MSTSIDFNAPYQINDFIVSPHLDQLECKGDIIKLEPKVMALLTYLVKNRGSVCSKGDISQAIWPRQEVSDEAITRLVFVLRNHLGDNAKSPKFISTVARKGYVFVATPTTVSKARSVNRALWFLPVFIAVALLAFIFDTPSGYKVIRTLPVTHDEGREYSYTRSDGWFAYLQQSTNTTSVNIATANQAPEILLEDTWRKRNLLGVDEFLLYIRFNSFEYQIVRQFLSGEPEVLISSDKPIYSFTYNNAAQNIIYNLHVNNESAVLYQYSFARQSSDLLLADDRNLPSQVELPILNEAGNVLFFVGIKSRKPTLYKLALDDNRQTERLNSDFEQIQDIQPGLEQDELLIAGTKGFTHGLWRLELRSGDLTLLSNLSHRAISDFYYDHTEPAIYLSTKEKRTDLTEISFTAERSALSGLNSTKAEGNGRYQRHNNGVYFASNRSGNYEIYSYDKTNQKVVALTQLAATKIWFYAASGDNNKLAVVYSTDRIYLGVIDISRRELTQAVMLDEIMFPLGWSQDNQYIYVSEHLKNIAIYQYDAESLTVKNHRQDMGLSAVEISPSNIIAFDYLSRRFVSYHFDTQKLVPLSGEVNKHMTLAPNKAHVTADSAWLVYEDGMQKAIHRLNLSEDTQQHDSTLVSQLLVPGEVSAVSGEQSRLLFASGETQQGDIQKLLLSKD